MRRAAGAAAVLEKPCAGWEHRRKGEGEAGEGSRAGIPPRVEIREPMERCQQSWTGKQGK